MANSPAPLDMRKIEKGIDRLTRGAGKHDSAASAGRRPASRLRRVVVAVDDSPSADRAIAWAGFLRKTLGSRLCLVHVEEPATLREAFGSPRYSPERHRARARDVLSRAVGELGRRGEDLDARLLEGFPVARIERFARATQTDVVVVGSRGGGPWRRFLLGSVASGIKNQARQSVLIARTTPPPRRILLAVDGSHGSKRAAATGLLLARAWKRPLTVIYVVPAQATKSAWGGEDPFEESFRQDDWPRLRKVDVTFQLRTGRVAETIEAVARGAKADLIVVGSRGLSGLRSLVPGSVSGKLANASRSSVLIVK